jgi:hypothetical protein
MLNRDEIIVMIKKNTYPKYLYIVKPVHVVTSIQQSLVFKGHLLLSCHRKFHMNFEVVTCLIRPPFICAKGDLFIQVDCNGTYKCENDFLFVNIFLVLRHIFTWCVLNADILSLQISFETDRSQRYLS